MEDLYIKLVSTGLKTIDEIPVKYRQAVIDKLGLSES